MRALCLTDHLELKTAPRPIPKQNEALIKVALAGICNTDLEIEKGYMGFRGILGHEFVGTVEEAADREWLGQRVCGEINFGCGDCEWCARGLSRHCPNRTVLGILNQGGAFAEFVVLPLENLHEVPGAVSDESAVFVEPLAAALEILEQVQVEPNHRVAVIGDGKLGILVGQVLNLTGAALTLLGKHARKLEVARSLGLDACTPDDIPGRYFDLVVEASGSASGFSTAMRLLRPRGTLVLKSTYAGNLELDAAPIVVDEITIVGSRCGPFEAALRLLSQKLVNVESLIDEIYPFRRALQAFEHAKAKDTLKIVIDFDSHAKESDD